MYNGKILISSWGFAKMKKKSQHNRAECYNNGVLQCQTVCPSIYLVASKVCEGQLAHLRIIGAELKLLENVICLWNLSKEILELNFDEFSFGTFMMLNGLFGITTESVSAVAVCLFSLFTVLTVELIADRTTWLILFTSCGWSGVFSNSGNANLNINSLSSSTPSRVRAFVDRMWKSVLLSNSSDKDWSMHLVNARTIGIFSRITVNKINA